MSTVWTDDVLICDNPKCLEECYALYNVTISKVRMLVCEECARKEWEKQAKGKLFAILAARKRRAAAEMGEAVPTKPEELPNLNFPIQWNPSRERGTRINLPSSWQ